MPTPNVAPDRKPAKPATTQAIALLKADHKKVAGLFEQYESAKDNEDKKAELADQICVELTIHATIEEEIFYPAARDALDEDDMDLLEEAEVEHDGVKRLVAEIEEALEGDGPDEKMDAKVKVLGEYVTHHVKEEETEMFPKLEATDMDMEAIGAELATRKQELLDATA